MDKVLYYQEEGRFTTVFLEADRPDLRYDLPQIQKTLA